MFSASLKVDARCTSLYLHPKHRRPRRKLQIVSSDEYRIVKCHAPKSDG